MALRFLAVMIGCVALACAGETRAATSAATVTAAIEIAPPPAAYGTDVDALREVASAELRAAQAPAGVKRRVVVSLAVAAPATDEPNECAVDATLRDERTGAVLAVVDATMRATGPLSREARRALAHAAVRSAARKVTTAQVPAR